MKTKSQADKEVGSKRNGRQAISRMRGSNMVILLHVLIFVSLLLTTGAQGAFAQEDYTPTPTEAATETATEALTETPAETATPEATATEEVTATPEVSETPTATQSTSVTEIETPMAPTYTPTVDATATIDQQTLLTQRVREAVSGFLGYVPITELIVSNVEYFDNWAFGTVAVTANPGVEASPFGYLFIAQSNSHEWRVAIEHTTLFSEWILEVPDELVSQEQKDILTAVSALGDGAALLSLPWATGQTWILTGGPHSNDGTGRPWSSLDFAVGGSGEVRAARDGIVYLDCANFVRINHSDGWQTGYYHLTGIVVSNGQTVTRGQLLGYTSSATGCGGSATGAHVHFSLRRSGVKQEINGRDIGGWTVEEGSSEYRGCMVRISDGSRQCSTYQGGSGSIYNNGTIGSGSGSGGGGPSGYTHCANEGGRCNFSGTADVAYGANGAFNYKYGVQNGIDCNNSVFGDPINGVVKACYYKITSTGTSCSSLSGEVRLYDNTNCGGVYTTGINSFGLWTLVPNFNDRAESIVVPSGWSARLYLHDYETSPSACFASTDTDLWNNTFSDGTTVANQATYVRVYNNTSCAGAPSAPSLSSPGNGQTFLEGDNISLSWSATGNEYYGEIWGGPGGTLTFGWQTGTSKVIGAQWAGYTYYWHVKARNSGGESGWSSTWSFTVIPNAPINLTATAASCGAVNLSWMGQSGSVEGYKVYRGGTLIQTLGSGVTSFQNTGLSGSTSYSYVVKAYRGSIESNASNTASVTTPACGPAKPTLVSPANGTTVGRYDSVTLQWNTASGATQYYAEFWGGPSIAMNSGWISGTSFFVGSNFWGGSYQWRVRSRNSSGVISEWSDTWTLTRKIGSPTNLTRNGNTLSWSASPDAPGNIDGYKIYLDGNQVGTAAYNATNYSFANPSCGVNHVFTVKAYKGTLLSDPSNSVSVFIDCPTVPSNDDIGGAKLISTTPYSDQLDVSLATVAGDDPDLPGCYRTKGYHSVWYKFTPPGSGTVNINTLGSDYDTVLSIWTGARGGLSMVACNDDSAGTFQSQLTAGLTGGVQYYILVGEYSGYMAASAVEAQGKLDPGVEALATQNLKIAVAYTVPVPAVPVLQAPAAGAKLTDYTPTLDWNDQAVPPAQYQVQLASASSFSASAILYDTSVTSSEFTFATPLQPGKLFYWRVRAFNGLGQASAWSAARYFYTGWLPPTLSAPANLEAMPNLRPAFDWTDVAGAASYTIQVSRYANLSSPLISVTVTGSAYVSTKDLTPGVTLYWRVRTNGTYGPSVWTETRSFTSPKPPSIPVVVAPKGNVLLTDYTPLFDWSNSSVPSGTSFSHYQIQVARDSGFTDLVHDEQVAGVTSSAFTPLADLESNRTYYWRVRAFNSAGQFSTWSVAGIFRTALLSPSLTSPANLAAMPNLRPAFDWTDVAGAASYTIQVSRYANLSSPLISVTVTGSAYVSTKDLTPGVTLYWRVRTNGTYGPSVWTETRSFTSPKPPSIPVVVAPKGNVLLTDYTPLFDWSNSSVPSGTSFSHYQIQVARDSGFTDLVHDEQVAGATSSAFTPLADLESNRTYYWRVRAFNASGQYSAWSATGIFRTAMLAPVQRLPEMNATLTTIRPTFDWDAVSGATAYRLQVSTSSTFGTLLINVNVTGTEYTSTVNLPKNTNLYWRVLANGANPSAWSPTWTFIIR